MDFTNFLTNYEEAVSMILFGIGFSNLLMQKNLIKKIVGMNIMDTSVYLFLAYQSDSERPCADRYCGIRFRHGADAGADDPFV